MLISVIFAPTPSMNRLFVWGTHFLCLRNRVKSKSTALGFSAIQRMNKRLVVVPEETEIVKRIYREYLEGASMLKIARGLEADAILNGIVP